MKKKEKTILGIVVIVVLLGFLVLNAVSSSDYSVSAAVAARDNPTDNLTGKVVRINGSMVPDTIKWDAYNRTLAFKLTDGDSTIDVIYQGNKPNLPEDSNETNIQAVVTGKFNNEVFESFEMITKCPSKYEEGAVVK